MKRIILMTVFLLFANIANLYALAPRHVDFNELLAMEREYGETFVFASWEGLGLDVNNTDHLKIIRSFLLHLADKGSLGAIYQMEDVGLSIHNEGHLALKKEVAVRLTKKNPFEVVRNINLFDDSVYEEVYNELLGRVGNDKKYAGCILKRILKYRNPDKRVKLYGSFVENYDDTYWQWVDANIFNNELTTTKLSLFEQGLVFSFCFLK
ncbi:hypothetical protein KKC59_03795, partial [bacterium]|nr:hypothetical protein [bacterium]